MLMNLYSVYDKVTQVYGPILMEVNDQSLLRNCKTMILNELRSNNASLDGFIARKSDLVVYKLGSFDTSSGKLVSNGEVQVFTVVELVDSVLVDVNNERLKNERSLKDVKQGDGSSEDNGKA